MLRAHGVVFSLFLTSAHFVVDTDRSPVTYGPSTSPQNLTLCGISNADEPFLTTSRFSTSFLRSSQPSTPDQTRPNSPLLEAEAPVSVSEMSWAFSDTSLPSSPQEAIRAVDQGPSTLPLEMDRASSPLEKKERVRRITRRSLPSNATQLLDVGLFPACCLSHCVVCWI